MGRILSERLVAMSCWVEVENEDESFMPDSKSNGKGLNQIINMLCFRLGRRYRKELFYLFCQFIKITGLCKHDISANNIPVVFFDIF